jgi:hypothetical protein
MDVSQILSYLIPSHNTLYVIALVAGLYVHYLAAKKNGRTAVDNFVDYWLVETPSTSVKTLVALAVAAGLTMKSGVMPDDTYSIFVTGFGTGFGLDAWMQAPPPAVAVPPVATKV